MFMEPNVGNHVFSLISIINKLLEHSHNILGKPFERQSHLEE